MTRPDRKASLSKIFQTESYAPAELAQIGELIAFDAAFYLSTYADIANAGLDPLQHFLLAGVNEARLPADVAAVAETIGFDPAFYAARYPDTADDPQKHFFARGAREQRLPFDLSENRDSELLLPRVLEKAGISHLDPLEAQQQLEPEPWRLVPEALAAAARRAGVVPKRYRNNYWLAMAIGLLAQGRFGAAVCCYNSFCNYYLPMSWLGNGGTRIIGAGRIRTTASALLAGGPIAQPQTARFVDVPAPLFLNRANRPAPPVAVPLPQPVYGVLHNVEAVGGSSLLLQAGHDVLYDYAEAGERAREPQCPNIMHILGDCCSFSLTAAAIEVEEAFSLLHDHSHNYHHWLLEVLPRYLLARREGMADTVPLLIENNLAPQLREILRDGLPAEPPLIEVPRGMSVQVRRLHVMTDLCVNTVHTTRLPQPGDVLFSATAVAMLRELAAPHFADFPGKYDSVLIIRRNVQFRRLVNRGVLATAMKRLGLWSFDPGEARWVDQVRVFSNARLIVSEAGAALANLVFCRPGATVIVLVHGHPNSNFYYLAQLAALVGVRLYFFGCHRLQDTHSIAVQDDMIVPVSLLTEWVARFMADPKHEPFPQPLQAPLPPGAEREPAGLRDRRRASPQRGTAHAAPVRTRSSDRALATSGPVE